MSGRGEPDLETLVRGTIIAVAVLAAIGALTLLVGFGALVAWLAEWVAPPAA